MRENKAKRVAKIVKSFLFLFAISMTLSFAQYVHAAGNDSANQADNNKNAKVYAYQVALNGQFNLRTYVEMTEEVAKASDIYMEYTINGKQQKAEPVYFSSDHQKVMFSCEVASSQVGDTIGQVFHYGSSTETFSDYSVKDYLDMIISNEYESIEYSDTQKLAKSLLDYAGYSQTYFEYKTNDLANTELTEKAVEKLTDTEVKSSIKVSDSEGVNTDEFTFAGASLVCTSKTKLRLYWVNEKHITESDFNKKYTVSVMGSDNVEKSVIFRDNYIIVSLDNISSSDYDNTFKVMISNGSVSAYRTYSVLNYIKRVMDTNNDKLKDLCKAMYLYYLESEDYAEIMSNDYIISESVKYHKIKNNNKIEGLEVIGVTEYQSSVTVPEELEKITVIKIAARAFMNNTTLTDIDLPDTIESIGTKAFAGCSNLVSMH